MQNIEDGFSSSKDDVSSESFDRPRYVMRQRRSIRERRKEQMRSEVSVHVKGSRRSRKKRRVQFTNASFGHVGSEMVVFKRKTR
ncbi:hypothetical protein QJS10_CPB11g02321 [Acorus calamus]|uniref:Uncharacterized protein n=1 Tax=Acorus calamus TaxID=4465 RepID=A0AAV9DWD7_ACOCL|nr:hypothetical protein QJS10_CPB11g02321 [Acorus calamus]